MRKKVLDRKSWRNCTEFLGFTVDVPVIYAKLFSKSSPSRCFHAINSAFRGSRVGFFVADVQGKMERKSMLGAASATHIQDELHKLQTWIYVKGTSLNISLLQLKGHQ